MVVVVGVSERDIVNSALFCSERYLSPIPCVTETGVLATFLIGKCFIKLAASRRILEIILRL
jgi:hypothetical protein